MSETVAKKVEAAVEAKVAAAVAAPEVNADATAIAPVTQAVMEEVGPRIDHLTGHVPLWQSQTFWGLVAMFVIREMSLRGWLIPAEWHGEILTLFVQYGPYACMAFIAWGRWFAKKPLFSSWYNRWKS